MISLVELYHHRIDAKEWHTGPTTSSHFHQQALEVISVAPVVVKLVREEILWQQEGTASNDSTTGTTELCTDKLDYSVFTPLCWWMWVSIQRLTETHW